MTSQTRIDANRRNAQKSTGPRTEAGKATSRWNALKHGLASPELILFDETEEAFEDFYAELRAAHAPVDAAEAAVVERIAAAHWRLRRVWRAEAAAFNDDARTTIRRVTRDAMQRALADAIVKDPPEKKPVTHSEAWRLAAAGMQAVSEDEIDEAAIAADGEAQPSLGNLAIWPERLAALARYETMLERQLHRLMLDLDRLQQRRRQRLEEARLAEAARREAEDRALRARRAQEAERAERSQLLDGHPMAPIIRATNQKFADVEIPGTKPNGADAASPSGPSTAALRQAQGLRSARMRKIAPHPGLAVLLVERRDRSACRVRRGRVTLGQQARRSASPASSICLERLQGQKARTARKRRSG